VRGRSGRGCLSLTRGDRAEADRGSALDRPRADERSWYAARSIPRPAAGERSAVHVLDRGAPDRAGLGAAASKRAGVASYAGRCGPLRPPRSGSGRANGRRPVGAADVSPRLLPAGAGRRSAPDGRRGGAPSELLGQGFDVRDAGRPDASDLPAPARPADAGLLYDVERSVAAARSDERGRSDGATGEPKVREPRAGVRAVGPGPEGARPPLADLGLPAAAPAPRGPAGCPPAPRGRAGFPPALRGPAGCPPAPRVPAGFPPAFRVPALAPDGLVPLALTGRRSGKSGMRNAPFQKMPRIHFALSAGRHNALRLKRIEGHPRTGDPQ
jgi:hypothetical protein